LRHLALEIYTACGRQDGIIKVLGNPWRKLHAVSEEAEAWVSLDLPETLPGAGIWLYISFAAGHNSERVFY